jgi:hypothetical protein
MTTLTITDFCGLSAELDLGEPLTLVLGENGAGKSRIAAALGRLLATESCKGKEIVSDDGKTSIQMNAGDAMRAIVWDGPGAGDPSLKGDQDALPHSSAWAAGLRHPLDLDGKARAQAFADIFKTAPSRKNLSDAFAKRDLSDHLDQVWDTIDVSGWDAATKQAEGTARALKGAWGEVTGATWGEKVGAAWEPDAKRSPDQAGLEEELKNAKLALASAEGQLAKAKAARAELPGNAVEAHSANCPWCDNPVTWQNGKMVKAGKVDPKRVREIRLEIAGADGEVSHAQGKVAEAEREIGAAQARLNDAADARRKAQERAAELHGQIMAQIEIARVCGPQGLRKVKLEHVLDIVNNHLAEMAKSTGLPLVEIDADLEVTMAGTPYRWLSRAETWICRTILQMEIARCDGSTMVVVDDLDIPISLKDRSAILGALHASGRQAVVMLAARGPDPAFDLARAGWGKSYWIDHANGLRPLAEAAPAQKAA